MAKKTKERVLRVSRLPSFFNKHTNKSVHVSIKNKHVQLTIQGEVHKHDEQYWITRGSAKTVIEMKRSGKRLSRLLNWPDKSYDVTITIMLAGETVASMTVPMRSKEKLPCHLE